MTANIWGSMNRAELHAAEKRLAKAHGCKSFTEYVKLERDRSAAMRDMSTEGIKARIAAARERNAVFQQTGDMIFSPSVDDCILAAYAH